MWRLAAIVLISVIPVDASIGRTGAAKAKQQLAQPAHQQTWHTYRSTKGAPAAAPKKAGSSLAAVSQVQLSSDQLPKYGPSFEQLSVEVTPETASRLHVKISPTGQQRWEVPESIIPRPAAEASLSNSSLLYDVTTVQPAGKGERAFALTVTRRATGTPIFDTSGHRFIFKDQYIELTTNVPEDSDLYGLGEVSLPTGLLLPRDGSIITLWNRDLPAAEPYANVYGSHAFYLQVNRDGSAHGVYFLNSNGMDVLLNATSLTYRVIGGLVDLYFFMGPSPEEVVRQYHAVIGAPAMPPYWSLGSHQGKWGYSNVSVVETVVANYSAAGVPLECIWVDIEYMGGRFQTMTFDETRFPVSRMRKFVDKLHAVGQHWVPIQDAGIAVAKGYKAYEDGSRQNVWIKDYKGDTYLGQVWPGETVYPDYLSNPNATAWLQRQLHDFYQQVPFDGLWLDMSEASNFCSGMTCQPDHSSKAAMHWLEVETPRDYNLSDLIKPMTTCQLKCEQAPASNRLANPPYAIHNYEPKTKTRGAPITSEIIHPTAKHADGTLEYNAHNLFGTAMAKSHYEAFTAVTGKRPFMILRSTFPGAGRWTGHWTGDNPATWQGLYESIASTLNPSLWGISMVGPDICGFIDTALATAEQMGFNGMSTASVGNPTGALSNSEYEELCNRWTSAGAWYPFSRNHMGYFARHHEPYRWPSVADAARKAYKLRYQLLTYLYGELFIAHSRGGTLARPLLFADSSDLVARNATAQWMMGEALLISPVLTPRTTKIQPHFTAGNWYSAWDCSRITVSKGRPVSLEVPLGDIAVHYRGGSIVPKQHYAAVTRDVRYSPVTLLVTLPAEPAGKKVTSSSRGPLAPYILEAVCADAHRSNAGKLVSCGLLYQDSDTIQVAVDNTVQVWYTAVSAPGGGSGSMSSTVKANSGEAAGKLRIEAVHILGAAPAAGQTAAPTASLNGKPLAAQYDAAAGALKISGIEHIVNEPLDIAWKL